MTTTALSQLPTLRDADQRRILVRYAAGEKANDVAATTGLDKELVVATIADLAKFDRGRARELVADYDRRAATVAASKAPKPAASQPAAQPRLVELDRVSVLLERGARSFDPTIRAKAKKIRGQLDELRTRLDAVAEQQAAFDAAAAARAAAQAKVDQARAALDAAVRELADLDPNLVPAAAGGPGPKVIRAWAKENGVTCPALGKVPRAVVQAYEAAHQGGAA